MSKDQFPPSINAGKLYERTSAKGSTYLVGFWGPLRLTAFKTDQTDEHGNPIWNLKVAEAPPREKPAGEATPQDKREAPRKADARKDWQKPHGVSAPRVAETEDLIPF